MGIAQEKGGKTRLRGGKLARCGYFIKPERLNPNFIGTFKRKAVRKREAAKVTIKTTFYENQAVQKKIYCIPR